MSARIVLTHVLSDSLVRHDGNSPALDTCFSADGSTVFSAGADKAVRMWQLGGGTTSGAVHPSIGMHDAPVRNVRFLPLTNLVVSGGWDRKLKFWDTRSPSPAGVIELSERVYAMDARGDLLVVGTADRQIYAYDVSSTPREISRNESPLKFMTRCISVFPDNNGFAIGSIEGRVGIHYVRPVPGRESFAFKCHRQESNVYSVNGISFNHPLGTFSTIGSDGVVTFWDKDNKQRLKAFPQLERTISCAAFNAQGTLFSYASSYDWSKGSLNVQPGNEIFVHVVQENEVKPKAKKSSTGYKR
jgi:mRNA export factor